MDMMSYEYGSLVTMSSSSLVIPLGQQRPLGPPASSQKRSCSF